MKEESKHDPRGIPQSVAFAGAGVVVAVSGRPLSRREGRRDRAAPRIHELAKFAPAV